jgi:phosphoglycerol transferase MdoB-like AlkP superfamily enzyme
VIGNGFKDRNSVERVVEMNKEKKTIKNQIKKGLAAIWSISPVRIFCLCVLLILIIEGFGRHSIAGGFEFLMAHPLRFLMNVFLIMTPFTVFYLIRKRSIGFVLVAFAWLAIGVINGIVLVFRVTPFSTIDFRLVDAALGVMGNYLEVWQMILLGIVAVVACLVVIYLIVKMKKYGGKMHYVRNAVLIVVYWLVMFFGMKGLVHAGVFATVLPNLAYAYNDYGVSYCFVVTGMRKGISKPINYSEERMESILKGINKKFKSEQTTEDEETTRNPNIIFLQLESFFDINHVKGYSFNENPVPYFEQLKEEYSSGFLTVPAFGAGTANTEFEVMTGMNLGFFSPGEYPYKTILKKRTCESVPYDLAQIGYGTHVIHNNTAKFYARYKVFPNLGFDTFSTIETMDSRETTKTGWAKDAILTDEIMDALISTDTPDYIYTISVQGHGDYYKEAAQVDDPEIEVGNVSSIEQANAVNYYVEQISEMDEFVQTLCERLESFNEDVVLVLYGDHLPGLGLTDEDLDNGDVYQTEYVIWNNFGMEKKDKDLKAYQLSAEVLNRLNIHTGTIMRYHQRYKNKKGYMSKLRALQYDMLYGEQYVYDGQTPFLQTDMEIGVWDVVTHRAVQTDEDTAMVYGVNYTQCAHVYVNGEEVDSTFVNERTMRINAHLEDGDEIQVNIMERERDRLLREGNSITYEAPENATSETTDGAAVESDAP